MSKDNEKPKEEGLADEQAMMDELGELMEGPSLVAQFANDEKLKLAIKTEGEFGPFIVIVFEGDGSAHFKNMKVGVSTWMLGVVAQFFQTMFELEAAANLMGQQQAKQRRGILKPGDVSLPPHLKAGPGG